MENFELNRHLGEPSEEGSLIDTPETTEARTERIINEQYETLIREHNPVDSGKEGLIFRLQAEEVNPDVKTALGSTEQDFNDDSAVKVLKVFSPGAKAIEHEFTQQVRAYNILNAARKDSAVLLAKVPAPIDFRKIHIEDDTRGLLNREGASLKGNEVEVMMMDFVGGEDLQTIFYRWIVKHAPKDKEYAVTANPDQADFQKLYQAVSGILEFQALPPEHNAEADEEISRRREKVLHFLKKTGFTLKQTIVDQIKNTRTVLQANRLYHNDEHERNFMVDGDQVYLIDFARATEKRIEDESDFNVDKLLEQLTPEFEIKNKAERQSSILSQVESIAKDEGLLERYKTVYSSAMDGSPDFIRLLKVRSEAATSTESSSNDFLALLVRLVRDNKLDKSDAGDIVEHMKQSLKVPVFKRGKPAGFNIRNPAVHNKMDTYKQLF